MRALICLVLSFFTAATVSAQSTQKAASPIKPAASDFAPLPQAKSSFGAAVADGWIYIYGGHVAKSHEYYVEGVVDTFQRLKIGDPKKWETLPSGVRAQGLALVAHDGKLYRIGGMHPLNKQGTPKDNISLASFARFDPKTNSWEDLPNLPGPRSSHDAVVVGDKIVVVGGWKQNGMGKKADWYSTTLVLDLKKQPLVWSEIPQPFQRRALTAAVYDHKVYVLAGIAPDGNKLNVDIFDPSKQTWSTGPEIPGPAKNGFAAASCVVDGRLYLSTGDGKISRLSVSGDAWEDVGSLRQPRIVHRMLTVQPNLFVTIGGGSPMGNIAATEAFQP